MTKELPKDIVDYIETCKQSPPLESHLISVLHRLQNQCGFLSEAHLQEVSEKMQIPSAKVSGVASFYHYFCLKPRGKHVITVCTGTSCHVKGADRLIQRVKDELGIEMGETTKDGLFTLEEARCLGMCALAPVLKIGEKIYSQVTPEQVSSILESYNKD